MSKINITFKTLGMGVGQQTVENAVYQSLEGTDYDQGQLEDLEATVDNCRRAIANIACHIASKEKMEKKELQEFLIKIGASRNIISVAVEEEEEKENDEQ